MIGPLFSSHSDCPYFPHADACTSVILGTNRMMKHLQVSTVSSYIFLQLFKDTQLYLTQAH